MNADSVAFLQAVVDAPSPSGFEAPVRRLLAERMAKHCDEVRHDVLGNVIGVINPNAATRVMLAGHCDEIGLMITNVNSEGYLNFAPVGGHDPMLLTAQRVLIHSSGGPVPGVIGKKPIHLMRHDKDSDKAPKIHELWIDIGAKDRADAEQAVAVGDYATVDAGFTRLRNDLVAARAFDDRVGAFAVAETMRLLSKSKSKLKVGVYGVATTQEELGLRGARVSAYGVDPHAGIAVDVGFASDYPTINKAMVGDLSLGKGPIIAKGPNINPVLGQMLLDVARKKRIRHQVEGEPRATGTDANAMQMTRAGVATALISIPNRYMHSPVEVVSLKDVDNTSKLMAATLLGMKAKQDFTPGL
jgi:endoglucanase